MVNIGIDDVLVRRILLCVGRNKCTKRTIEENYDRIYPPTREDITQHEKDRKLRKNNFPSEPTFDSAIVLDYLVTDGYLKEEFVTPSNENLYLESVVLYSKTRKG